MADVVSSEGSDTCGEQKTEETQRSCKKIKVEQTMEDDACKDWAYCIDDNEIKVKHEPLEVEGLADYSDCSHDVRIMGEEDQKDTGEEDRKDTLFIDINSVNLKNETSNCNQMLLGAHQHLKLSSGTQGSHSAPEASSTHPPSWKKNMAECQQERVVQLKTFRPRKDVLGVFDDAELIRRYRMDRAGILFVTDLMRNMIESPTERNMAITPELKVIVTLHYLATGKMQLCIGDDFGPTQPTLSRVIAQTLKVLSAPEIVRCFIKFPTDLREIQTKQAEFMQVAGFPGVVGAIDGTHVRIMAPSLHAEHYVNIKNYHSINTQIVFDAKYRILNIVANWPGSTHDSRILQESGLRRLFESNRVPPGCHLLGDSGYPCKHWLLTPYLRPQDGVKTAYNRSHKKARCIVERGIGQLKRRWHVLRGEVRVKPEKVCHIIMACAVLHNICKQRNLHIPDENEIENHHENNLDMENLSDLTYAGGGSQEGLSYRDNFANIHFRAEQ